MLKKVNLKFHNKLFINGKFVDAEEQGRIIVVNPHDNSKLLELSEAREADVDKAVTAAKSAFDKWGNVSPSDRGLILNRLADKIEEHFEELAQLESLDTGHPIRDTRLLDLPRALISLRYFSGIADKIDGRQVPVEPGFLNYVKRVPVGVVGQIVPWNFPLMFVSWKLGPALAAGNTVVLKPSELVPLSTLRIAEMCNEVGIPEGVVNIIPGYGEIAGKRLAEHSDVNKISFTGSTKVGRKIIKYSANNLSKVSLELGGKGPNIIFEDADIDKAIAGSAFAIFHNQGQACIAGSRLLLHERIADEFIEKFVCLAKSIRLGDPLDSETEMGPLTSKVHLDRVLHYIKIAKEENGKVLCGGKQPDIPALKKGFYIEPTVMEVKSDNTVFKEEIFGPFVSITRFKDEEQSIQLANNTDYGLGSGLWTNNLQRAHRVAEKIKAGMVWINCYKRAHPGSPLGGVGHSGYGRDLGIECLDEYTEAKSFWVNYDAQTPPFYKR